ncbi:MAG TPA: response regulator [Myxococcaceae bacterium]|nr:response regulator [Myxococcaceae bacterium]
MRVPARSKGRILIVSAGRGQRIQLERVLARAGHEVACADSAEAALQRLSKERFDLLIAEEPMAGIGGAELIRALSALPVRPVAILISDSPGRAPRGSNEHGAHAYLARPLRMLELLAACDSAIREAQQRSGRGVLQ